MTRDRPTEEKPYCMLIYSMSQLVWHVHCMIMQRRTSRTRPYFAISLTHVVYLNRIQFVDTLLKALNI